MQSAEILIKNKTGIHARPAGGLVSLCQGFPCEINIVTNLGTFNAKQIFSVLLAGMTKGTVATIEASGDREEEALRAVVEYIDGLEE